MDCYITAAVRCAPPDNKPLPSELANCAPFLDRELRILKDVKVVVALGKIGFDAYLNYLKRNDILRTKAAYVFAHAARYSFATGVTLLASYHPSNQNTATGKLTAAMFEAVFREARKMASAALDSFFVLLARSSCDNDPGQSARFGTHFMEEIACKAEFRQR